MYIAGLIILLVYILNAGCDSALNIEPENVLVENDVFADEDLAERAVGQAYVSFFQAATGYAYAVGDFSTDITHTSEFLQAFSNGQVNPDHASVENFWADYYSTINLANSLVVKIPEKGTYAQELMDRHVAEAKFIRAYSYFNLLILYGQGGLNGDESGMGLPLRLVPYEGYEQGADIPRSSTLEVYEQIIDDLTSALPNLPKQYDTNVDTRSRATKGSVQALLSRIYLYRGNNDEAAKYAKQVLERENLYSLESTCLDLFPLHDDPNVIIPMSEEYIFGFPTSYNQLGDNNVAFSYYYKRYLWANEDFIKQYEDNDARKTDLIFKGWDEADTPANIRERRTTFKFNEQNGRDNVPMIRLAEIMLTRAEALAQTLGINQESVSLLNEVRNRADPDAMSFTTGDFSGKEELVNRILLERKYELAFEGHHRFDLIRTGQLFGNPPLPEDKYILPIPQVDIAISGGVLEQNPRY